MIDVVQSVQEDKARTFNSWDERSTIRNRPLRTLHDRSDQVHFPRQEQPLCLHPIVQALGIEADKFILTQSSYRFMAGIFEHETKVVTEAVQKMAYGPSPLSESMKQELLTVVMDELYHAYVARDFVEQLRKSTGIEPLPFARESNIGRALDLAKREVPSSMSDVLSAVAICIIENVITQELIGIDVDPNVNRFFYEINRDHIVDEGRHAGIFTAVVSTVWSALTESEREFIQNALPTFVKEWLSRDLSIFDDTLILRSLNLNEDEIARVIYDTHPRLDFASLAKVNPTVRHIEQWLRKVGVWTRKEALWEIREPLSPPKTRSDRSIGFLLQPLPDGFREGIESQQCPIVSSFESTDLALMFLTYLSHVLQQDLVSFPVLQEKNGVCSVSRWSLEISSHDLSVRDWLNQARNTLKTMHLDHQSLEDSSIALEVCFGDESLIEKSCSFDIHNLRVFFSSNKDTIRMSYHPSLYDKRRIAALLLDFSHYIKSANSSPLCLLSSLPLVARDSGVWNTATSRTSLVKTTILDELAQRVAEQPEHIAVRSHDEWLTYELLDQRVSALSMALVKAGFPAGSRIGVQVSGRLNFVCSLLGVMKAGLVAVPLPVDCPAQHLDELVERSKLRLILCDLGKKGDLDANLVIRRGISTWECREELFVGETLDKSLAEPDAAACVLFTSGTSGEPKGVVLYHDEIAGFALGAKESFPLLPTDVMLQFSNLCFDASLAEIVNTIASGSTLALPSSHIMDSPTLFLDECQSLGVTILNLPSAFWGQWSRASIDLPKDLRIILVYGESLSQDCLKDWYRKGSNVSLINTYGPTEATIGASYCHLDSFEGLRHDYQLIGRPFPGRAIHILDQFQRPLPRGATGEIYLGGGGVKAFYLDDKGLASVTIVHKELGTLYATGDLGQWLSNSDQAEDVLAFHGRNDHQVKIRGYRVELRAIEKILASHPAVAEAIAMVRQQENANFLVTFVLKSTDVDTDESDLSQYLQERLPRYSCPSRICILDKWPLTERGKVDRSQLLKILQNHANVNPSTTAVTSLLSEMWCELLGAVTVTNESNFFDLGGHSLLAMTLVGRVNERWSAGLTLRAVIENPRFESMNLWLLNALRVKGGIEAQSNSRTQALIESPVSYGQLAMLVSDRMSENSTPQYNVAFGLHFQDYVDDDALLNAVNYVLDRQSALRSVFSWDAGEAKQRLVERPLVAAKERVRFDEYRKISEHDARQSHSLLEAPPIRIRQFQICDRSDEVVLYFNLHHVIHDGISIAILMRELKISYDAFCRGQEPSLPTLTESYGDFAAAIRQRVESDRQESIPFWRQYLDGATPLALNFRKEGQGSPLEGASYEIAIGSKDLNDLRRLSSTNNTSMSSILLTAVFYALRERTTQSDYTIGSVMSLREKQAHETLVGMFVNMVLLRSKVRFDLPIVDNVAGVQRSIHEVLSHRFMPLSMLIAEVGLPRDPYEHKVFDVMVNYHAFGSFFDPASSSPLPSELRFVDNKTVNVGLAIDFYDWGEQSLQMRLSYCEGIYDAKHIIALGQDVQKWIGIFAEGDWHSEARDL